MAYTSSAVAARDLAFTQTPARAKLPVRAKRGLFGRLLESMMLARRRQAEREIARYLVDSGGKFTDETEREIERRFLTNASNW
jgi:hypothetical protein